MVQLSCFTQVRDDVHVYIVHFQTDFKPTAVNAHSQDWGKQIIISQAKLFLRLSIFEPSSLAN